MRVLEGGAVMVLVSSHRARWVREYNDRWPGRIGHLFTPDGWRRPHPGLAYAIDNGAFAAWTNAAPFDAEAYWHLLDRAHAHPAPPMWAAVPDVVADRTRTLEAWQEWAGPLRRTYPGLALAFVVQDGMTAADVPADAAVVFVGGSTAWKWAMVGYFCARFPRVHVGRVNTPGKLRVCAALGAESVDGTGWYHYRQREQLAAFFADAQMDLFS